MADDARTHGTFWQNLALDASAFVDLEVDAPWIAYNRATGSSAVAPVHFAASVYADQVAGLYTDADGNPLSSDDVQQASAAAEDQGAVIDAAVLTGQQISNNPLQIVPTWVLVLLAIVGVLVIGYYALQIARLVRG